MSGENVTIIGGGIAGLGTALFLPPASTVILEAQSIVGGTCRTIQRGDFRFDRAGHFLHLGDSRTQSLIERLLPNQLTAHTRQAAIYMSGEYIPHPFQGHLGWLPADLRQECLTGFVQAVANHAAAPPETSRNLLEWFQRSFGTGITERFLRPHNEKAYCCDLTELEPQWVTAFVPQPSIDLVIDGALAQKNSDRLGYNAEFHYPSSGGIEILPSAMASQLDNVMLGRRVVSVDSSSRSVRCSNGENWNYDKLVSTMPLRDLVALTEGLPASVTEAAKGLRSVDVLDIQLSVSAPAKLPYHWVYFPDPEVPFVRAVFASNVCPVMAPRGSSTLHIEVNVLAGSVLDVEELKSRCLMHLDRLGVLSKETVVGASVERINSAYVIHDHFRQQMLPSIQRGLSERGIFSIGRYGSWGYGGMESALLDGMDIAGVLSEGSIATSHHGASGRNTY